MRACFGSSTQTPRFLGWGKWIPLQSHRFQLRECAKDSRLWCLEVVIPKPQHLQLRKLVEHAGPQLLDLIVAQPKRLQLREFIKHSFVQLLDRVAVQVQVANVLNALKLPKVGHSREAEATEVREALFHVGRAIVMWTEVGTRE